jgi:hypothetical protein
MGSFVKRVGASLRCGTKQPTGILRLKRLALIRASLAPPLRSVPPTGASNPLQAGSSEIRRAGGGYAGVCAVRTSDRPLTLNRPLEGSSAAASQASRFAAAFEVELKQPAVEEKLHTNIATYR